MELLIMFAALVVIAVLAPRFGADTHRSREWEEPIDSWPAGVRNPLPKPRRTRLP